MKRWWGVMLALLWLVALAGPVAAQQPTAERRLVLGVLPILVDGDSAILHPQAEQVRQLLRRVSQGQAEQLGLQLKHGGRFFDVRLATMDAAPLATELLAGRTAADAKTGREDYRFNPATARRIAQAVPADRLLVVVLYGRQQKEKRNDRKGFNYLETTYDSIDAQAALLDADGQVVWRWHSPSGEAWLPLQYANFDDAYYNKTDKVPLVWLTLDGLERQLTEKKTTVFSRPPLAPKRYLQLFDELQRKLEAYMDR